MQEVLDTLNPRPGQVVVDATLGHGGHSLAILRRLGGEGHLVGIERDPLMLAAARQRIESAAISRSLYTLVHADHADLLPVLADVLAEDPHPAAILFDLGPSTPQLLDPARGYSWTSDVALDMRRDPAAGGESAADIVNTWSPEELTRLFRDLSDEHWSKRIADFIAEARLREPIRTGRQLGEIVGAAIPRKAWPPKTHPATRVFMALRIQVCGEYRTLEKVLPEAFGALKPGGRLAVITFHSGEDRRVKDYFRAITTPTQQAPWPLPQHEEPAPARLLTKKGLTASAAEVDRNPAARSARLRAVEKRAD
jgi:16S rRNA (cytosine1402-N4)-methyltransferase